MRLVKLLGMLGSAHDGERASAGLLATRLLRAHGIAWDELLLQRKPSPKADADPTWHSMSNWRTKAAACLVHRDLFNPWEQNFLDGLRRFRTLSPRQWEILVKLFERVRDAGGNR